MTAVVMAMLVIVIVATGVVGAVGGQHHMAHSPDMQVRMRRWRFVLSSRTYEAREGCTHVLRVTRRAVAERLARRPGAEGAPDSTRVRRLLPR